MTITEAYARLEALLSADQSITIQVDTWKHYFAGERREIETTFVVSWSDGPIINGKTLEEAVTNAERRLKGEEAPFAKPEEVDAFVEEAEAVGASQ